MSINLPNCRPHALPFPLPISWWCNLPVKWLFKLPQPLRMHQIRGGDPLLAARWSRAAAAAVGGWYIFWGRHTTTVTGRRQRAVENPKDRVGGGDIIHLSMHIYGQLHSTHCVTHDNCPLIGTDGWIDMMPCRRFVHVHRYLVGNKFISPRRNEPVAKLSAQYGQKVQYQVQYKICGWHRVFELWSNSCPSVILSGTQRV